MYSEEESELRDLIIQNLENSGFLKKIKAELRAGVFLALEEDGNLRNKISLFNEKLDNYISTTDGKLMLSIVHEFLEFFNLNFTLSVFEPEVASSTPCLSRSELCDQLNIKTSDINGPVISALFKNLSYNQTQSSVKINPNELKKVPENLSSILKDTEPDKTLLDKTFNLEQIEHSSGNSFSQNNLESDIRNKSSKDDAENVSNNTNILSLIISETATDKLKENAKTEKSNHSDFFKESKDLLASDHDPFFDEPVPPEKTSFFSFSDSLKDKPENKITSIIKGDSGDSKKSSLSSLRDLPSLSAGNEWTFSRDSKNNLPSLDVLKSLTSSETPAEEIVSSSNKKLERKDSDIVESNEESSEKQVSEESIEEEIIEEEEDFSTGMDDLLNSSLSLGDEVTTDQTVSQVSIVEGIDHIEPCNS